jgi:hypothetical protein
MWEVLGVLSLPEFETSPVGVRNNTITIERALRKKEQEET